MKMGATDFVPRTEYQPDAAYMRAMNVEFSHPFSVFVDEPNLATQFRVVLEQCFNGTEIEISDVTVA